MVVITGRHNDIFRFCHSYRRQNDDISFSGLRKPKDIVRALFQFVKRVKVNGVSEKLWKENKQIDELKFKFKEKEDPASYARFALFA